MKAVVVSVGRIPLLLGNRSGAYSSLVECTDTHRPGECRGGSEPVSVCLEMRICGDYVFFGGWVGDGGASVDQSLRLSASVSFSLSLCLF